MAAADLKTALLIALQTTGEERVAKLRQALVDLGISADKAEDLAGGLDTELKQIADSSGKAEKKTLDLVGVLKTVAGAAIVREFFNVNAEFESMAKTLEIVTGSSQGAKAEMEFIRAEATRLGIEVGSAASSYINLAASAKGTNLEGAATREIWSAVVGTMSALGRSSADVEGAIIQLGQGISKGKFELEDLKSIAERIPGFFKIFADSLGVTTAELFDMISAGELTADKLPKLAEALKKVGDAGGEIDTATAAANRLKNTWTDVQLAIGDSGALEAMKTALKGGTVAVVTLWEGFEFLGRTIANVAYTLTSLDFSGWQKRQQESLAAARADVTKTIEKIFPLKTGLDAVGAAGAQMGDAIAQGAKQAGEAIKVITLDAKQAAEMYQKSVIPQLQAAQKVATAQNALAQSNIQVTLAQQKGLYDLAKATGDTTAAKVAKNKITELEIELSKLQAQAAIAEAETSVKVARAKLMEAEAKGENVQAAKDELRATEIGLEIAKNKLVIVDNLSKSTKALANASGGASGAIGDMGGSMAATGGAAQNLTRDIEELTAAEQRLADVRDAANAARGQGGATNWEYLLGSKGIKLSTEQLAAFKSQIQSVYDYLSGTFDGKVVSSTYLLNEALDRTVALVKNGTSSGGATTTGGSSTSTSTSTTSASRSGGVNLTIHVSGPTDVAALARLIVPEIDKITRWRA